MSLSDFGSSFPRFIGQRSILQAAVAVAGLVPVMAGAWGVLADLSGTAAGLASHERYLSGLLLAIGVGFWSTIPAIERKASLFRLLTLLVIGGGLCRLLGVALGDGVRWSVALPLLMELVVTPALCLWQSRVAARWPVVAVSRPLPGLRARTIPGRFQDASDAAIDRIETILARLYCGRRVVPPATYVPPPRRKAR